MSIRSAYETTPELISEFEFAGEERYLEAIRLLAEGHFAGCVYLSGYVAEIQLKCYCATWRGGIPSDIIWPRLVPMFGIGPRHIDKESKHSIRYWAMLLEIARSYDGSPMPAAMSLDYGLVTERIYNAWWVGMRYHKSIVSAYDAQQIVADVSWLRSKRTELLTP